MCVCGFSTLSSPGRHLISTTAASAAVAHSGVDPQQSARCDGAREMPLFHRLHDRIGIRIYSLFCLLLLLLYPNVGHLLTSRVVILYSTVQYSPLLLLEYNILFNDARRQRERERER